MFKQISNSSATHVEVTELARAVQNRVEVTELVLDSLALLTTEDFWHGITAGIHVAGWNHEAAVGCHHVTGVLGAEAGVQYGCNERSER